jgi:hypothetical protein
MPSIAKAAPAMKPERLMWPCGVAGVAGAINPQRQLRPVYGRLRGDRCAVEEGQVTN